MVFAWVTLATNDSYSLGALVLAHSLRRATTVHQLAVLITPAVSSPMRDQLATVFDVVQVVDVLDSKDAANLALLKRPELGITFTKIHCWRLTQFEKCVFLDADTLVVRNCDELFEREELSAAPDVGWPDCFNSGVFVFKPAMETFTQLIQFAVDKGSFDGGDQGLLNQFFSTWATDDIKKHLPFVYNLTSVAVYSYIPAFKQYGADTRIVHFIGPMKPWLQQVDPVTRAVTPSSDSSHLQPLLQQWWDLFCEKVHPGLSENLDCSGLLPTSVRPDNSPDPSFDSNYTITEPQPLPTPSFPEPYTPYIERDDERQYNRPYLPFHVVNSEGELLNITFGDVARDIDMKQALETEKCHDHGDSLDPDPDDQLEHEHANEASEDVVEDFPENEQTHEASACDHEPNHVPYAEPSLFDYHNFIPDEACISSYLDQNVVEYQPYNQYAVSNYHEPFQQFDSSSSDQHNLPRFLTIPEDDARQSGKEPVIEPWQPPPQQHFYKEHNYRCQEEYNIPSERAASPVAAFSVSPVVHPEPPTSTQPPAVSRSKSMTTLFFDAQDTSTFPIISQQWKSQSNINEIEAPKKQFLIPGLKPLVPKPKSPAYVSPVPKYTEVTEVHMVADYSDPFGPPADKIGFVEREIWKHMKVPSKFSTGPSIADPIISSLNKQTVNVTSAHISPMPEVNLYVALSECNRQAGNKPLLPEQKGSEELLTVPTNSAPKTSNRRPKKISKRTVEKWKPPENVARSHDVEDILKRLSEMNKGVVKPFSSSKTSEQSSDPVTFSEKFEFSKFRSFVANEAKVSDNGIAVLSDLVVPQAPASLDPVSPQCPFRSSEDPMESVNQQTFIIENISADRTAVPLKSTRKSADPKRPRGSRSKRSTEVRFPQSFQTVNVCTEPEVLPVVKPGIIVIAATPIEEAPVPLSSVRNIISTQEGMLEALSETDQGLITEQTQFPIRRASSAFAIPSYSSSPLSGETSKAPVNVDLEGNQENVFKPDLESQVTNISRGLSKNDEVVHEHDELSQDLRLNTFESLLPVKARAVPEPDERRNEDFVKPNITHEVNNFEVANGSRGLSDNNEAKDVFKPDLDSPMSNCQVTNVSRDLSKNEEVVHEHVELSQDLRLNTFESLLPVDAPMVPEPDERRNDNFVKPNISPEVNNFQVANDSRDVSNSNDAEYVFKPDLDSPMSYRQVTNVNRGLSKNEEVVHEHVALTQDLCQNTFKSLLSAGVPVVAKPVNLGKEPDIAQEVQNLQIGNGNQRPSKNVQVLREIAMLNQDLSQDVLVSREKQICLANDEDNSTHPVVDQTETISLFVKYDCKANDQELIVQHCVAEEGSRNTFNGCNEELSERFPRDDGATLPAATFSNTIDFGSAIGDGSNCSTVSNEILPIRLSDKIEEDSAPKSGGISQGSSPISEIPYDSSTISDPDIVCRSSPEQMDVTELACSAIGYWDDSAVSGNEALNPFLYPDGNKTLCNVEEDAFENTLCELPSTKAIAKYDVVANLAENVTDSDYILSCNLGKQDSGTKEIIDSGNGLFSPVNPLLASNVHAAVHVSMPSYATVAKMDSPGTPSTPKVLDNGLFFPLSSKKAHKNSPIRKSTPRKNHPKPQVVEAEMVSPSPAKALKRKRKDEKAVVEVPSNRFELLSEVGTEVASNQPESKTKKTLKKSSSSKIFFPPLHTLPGCVNTCNGSEELDLYIPEPDDYSGIAGAIAQLNLQESLADPSSLSPSASAAQAEYLRRQSWETGNIDYLGRDSFANIWSKISETLSEGDPQPTCEDVVNSRPIPLPVIFDAQTIESDSIETLPCDLAISPEEGAEDDVIFDRSIEPSSGLPGILEEAEESDEILLVAPVHEGIAVTEERRDDSENDGPVISLASVICNSDSNLINEASKGTEVAATQLLQSTGRASDEGPLKTGVSADFAMVADIVLAESDSGVPTASICTHKATDFPSVKSSEVCLPVLPNCGPKENHETTFDGSGTDLKATETSDLTPKHEEKHDICSPSDSPLDLKQVLSIGSDTTSAFVPYKATSAELNKELEPSEVRRTSLDNNKEKKGVLVQFLEFVGVRKKDEPVTSSSVFYCDPQSTKQGPEEISSPVTKQEGRKKSPSPRLIVTAVPDTLITLPTPPVKEAPELSSKKKTAISSEIDKVDPCKSKSGLTVNSVILDTPPAFDSSPPSLEQSKSNSSVVDQDSIKKEIDGIIAQAKLIAEEQVQTEPIYSNVMKKASKTVTSLPAPPPTNPTQEFEELKVTSKEERTNLSSKPSTSKLSNQILKAIPPPRRKAISEAKKCEATDVDVIIEKPLNIVELRPCSRSPRSFSESEGEMAMSTPPVPPRRNRSKQRSLPSTPVAPSLPQPPPKRKLKK